MLKKFTALVVALCIATPAIAQVETPSQLYGRLFEDVQMKHVFPDGKTFADAVANDPPATIMERYRQESARPGSMCWSSTRARFGAMTTCGRLSSSDPWGRSAARVT